MYIASDWMLDTTDSFLANTYIPGSSTIKPYCCIYTLRENTSEQRDLSRKTRIAFIHATRVAIDPIELAAKALWPEAETVTILEEALSMDRAANTVPMSEINARIVDLARYAERLNPDGILYTCSAFGEGIEQAARTSNLPVHKPNEAMFDTAFDCGNRIAMIYTFEPSVASMEKEFSEAAGLISCKAEIHSVCAKGAREALKAGHADTHNKLVAEVAVGIVDADAIMLAQFSTAQAMAAVRAVTNIPVLSSPEAAINKMKRQVEKKYSNFQGATPERENHEHAD